MLIFNELLGQIFELLEFKSKFSLYDENDWMKSVYAVKKISCLYITLKKIVKLTEIKRGVSNSMRMKHHVKKKHLNS